MERADLVEKRARHIATNFPAVVVSWTVVAVPSCTKPDTLVDCVVHGR